MKAKKQLLLPHSTKPPGGSWSDTSHCTRRFVKATVSLTIHKNSQQTFEENIATESTTLYDKKIKAVVSELSVAIYLWTRKDVKFSAHNLTNCRKKSLVAFRQTKTFTVFGKWFANISFEFDAIQCEHDNMKNKKA